MRERRRKRGRRRKKGERWNGIGGKERRRSKGKEG